MTENNVINKLKKKYNNKKVNVLGTKYTIFMTTAKEDKQLTDCYGYCSYNLHKIVIRQDLDYFKEQNEEWITHDIKHTIRHELIHAFYNESGLMHNSCKMDGAWTLNEEMIDWLATQTPKIFKVFNELDLL